MITRPLRSELQVLLILLLLIAPGCQQLLSFQRMKLATLPSASADHPVYEAICLWEPGEGTGLDGLPSRGFNGKVMFFARGFDSSVRVKGDMTVYVFDDQGTVEQQGHPIHQFNFSNEAIETFLMNSELGASYQMFIPYSRKGQHKATCSLRVRLTPDEGRPVYSKMGAVILPGLVSRPVEKPVTQKEQVSNEGVRLVSQEIPAAQASVVQAGMSTTSVDTRTTTSSLASEDKQRLMSALSEMTRGTNLQSATVQGATATTNLNHSTIVPATSQTPVSAAQPPKAVEFPSSGSSTVMRLKAVATADPKPAASSAVTTNPLAEEKPATNTATGSHPLGD